MRVPLKHEVAHGEFDDWSSCLSTSDGLQKEPSVSPNAEWCDRIHARTGIARSVIAQALEV